MFEICVVVDSPEFENEPEFDQVCNYLLWYLNKEFSRRKVKVNKIRKLLIHFINKPYDAAYRKPIPGIGPISFVYFEFDFEEFYLKDNRVDRQNYLFLQISKALEFSSLEGGWGVVFSEIFDQQIAEDLKTPLPEPDLSPLINYYEEKIDKLRKKR